VKHGIHYRLVLGEAATPLQDVLDVRDALFVPMQSDMQLNMLIFSLAKPSWVHRDLRVETVFCFRNNDSKALQLKLGDLEYAKEFGSDE